MKTLPLWVVVSCRSGAMSIPDYQSLMLPVLVASSKGEVRIGPVAEELANQLGLSSEEQSELLPSGKQTVITNRAHWAKLYLSKSQLVETTRRGYFQITERGRKVLQSQPLKIDNKFLDQFEEFRQFRERSSTTRQTEGETPVAELEDQKETPDETMRMSYRQIEDALIHDLLDRIRQAPPDFFERLMVNLLLSMGYGGSTENAGRRGWQIVEEFTDQGVSGCKESRPALNRLMSEETEFFAVHGYWPEAAQVAN